MVAIMTAASMNAQTRTTIWEGEKTMDASWPGIGIATTQFATASAGDKIIVTISKADNSINTDWTWGPQVFIKLDWQDFLSAKAVENGATNVEIGYDISADELAKIKAGNEIEIQGMNIIVVKCEIEASVPTAEVIIWEGECNFGNWAEGTNVEAAKFANANEGDVMEFVYTTTTNTSQPWYQFKTIYSGTEDTLTSNASELNDWGCATVNDGSTSYKIVLNAADVAKLKELGMYVNGKDIILTKIVLHQPVTTGIQTAKLQKAENNTIYNLAGQVVDENFKGIVIKNGKKMIQK